MKKNLFSKYIALFLAIAVFCFSMLVVFLSFYTARYFSQRDKEDLELAARNVNLSISSMIDLSQMNFDHFLKQEKSRLYEVLAAQANGGRIGAFITDGNGNVVVAISSEMEGQSLSPSVMTESSRMAREGKDFTGDLGGFLPKKNLCRVILLEKEYSISHHQRVGAIFLYCANESINLYVQGIIWGLLIAALILISTVVLTFRQISRRIVGPLQELSDVAESFAGGDFSRRVTEDGGEVTPLLRTFNQMADRVEENEKNRQVFVSNVSHDLRTPLTTIGGFVQNMADGNIPQEKQGRYFGIILDEVNRLSRLVQTLLETSRMTSGQRKYNFAPMDLCELGRVTLLSFENLLEEKSLEVAFDASFDNMLVLADKDAIQQVVFNLIDNAIKFTPEKGDLSISVRHYGEKAVFGVRNSGEGIPEEELKNLFDRFYKSDRSRGLDKKGMGLGLFIAKSIISAHGEEIWVESRYGDYTEFFFSLPLVEKEYLPQKNKGKLKQ